jgi:hypothetical protein
VGGVKKSGGQEKATRGAEILAADYGRLTERLATTDLQTAKVLGEELAGAYTDSGSPSPTRLFVAKPAVWSLARE